ncbi:unnamed protein product [Strongylus vulgaris]|uniref:Uncharacterized protein n=1 Tax=Strongylus vulgaris TaxID=40348 RepID=A0A3P7KYD2_STRVU|nr:unnamed protein product [Strongylus vulgaris]
MAGGGEEHAAHASAQDDADDSDGDGADEILEESPCKRWSKRREQVKQRDVPGIDVAYLAMDNDTGNEVVWNEVQFSERKNFRAQEVCLLLWFMINFAHERSHGSTNVGPAADTLM